MFGGASLTGGVQSGGGTTQLFGAGSIGGSFAIDGGRTVQNNGWLNWSSGDVALGSGDPTAAVQTGTLDNAAGATFYVTATGGRITGTAGVVENAGVIAVYAGAGEADVDAALDNTGYIQALSGTLSLNGGGSSGGFKLIAGSGAVLRFGAPQRAGTGGTFTVTGGSYFAPVTEIAGSTLNLAAAAAAAFRTSLTISAGTLKLGGAYGSAESFSLTGGTLSIGSQMAVSGVAALAGGLVTGTGGVLALAGQASLSGGVAIDGGTEVDNSGSLVWTGGALALGAGDGSLASHAGRWSMPAGRCSRSRATAA